MEVLTQALRTEISKKKSGIGFKISPRADKLSYLLFADDCLQMIASFFAEPILNRARNL